MKKTQYTFIPHSLIKNEKLGATDSSMEIPPQSFSNRKSQLSAAKRALLEKRLRGELVSPAKTLTIPKRSPEATLLLSFAQERLWFFNLLEPANPAYNSLFSLKLSGHLDIAALEQSINSVIERHEILRTNFTTENGEPQQVIHAHRPITLSRIDLRHHSVSEQTAEVNRLAAEHSQHPFDFAQAPLLRVMILQLGTIDYIILTTIHHIINDGWSIGIFIQELFTFYQDYRQGIEPILPELPIQYADYALWQRQYLQGDVLEKQLNYWKQQLAGIPSLLQLPSDRPRPPVQTNQGQTLAFSLNPTLTQQLRQLCQNAGTTLFMTLLAAFAVLLYRYSGQEDIAIGSPIANRDRTETQHLIGCLVNTIVLRTYLENNPSFTQLLAQVRETTLEAYAHQQIPFEKVVEALQPERNLSHTPLFQVMFVLQNTSIAPLKLPGLTLTPLQPQVSTALFDLTLTFEETATTLVGSWEYSTDLFAADTITRMTGHFQTLLEAIVVNPAQGIGELPLLTPSELHLMLVEWNNTATPYPKDYCFHQLFEQQVQRTPEATAVVFDNQHLTYQELDLQANQLAHYLQTIGVGAEVLVGLCVERSLDMVVGILGIFKAGGVYVPLEPTYPQERLAYILADASVAVLLTQRKLADLLPKHQTQIVYIDDDRLLSPQQKTPPICQSQPHNLAYAIYTSGSTGQPKGVLIEHLGLLNHLYAMIANLDLKETDAIAQTAPISFDISIWQILTLLLIGGRVHVFKYEIVREPVQLLEQIERQAISVLQIVPSLLKMLLEEVERSQPQIPHLCKLRWLLVTGEAFETNLQDWWFDYYSHIPMMNAYGPAECADDVTLYPYGGTKRAKMQIE
ncbi:hypothetical protein FD723_36255 (plasmid) [Nostoc sp. C052]|uniref:non-ribosomal peptide synthetase n=1 Tax=Nostoc sp. C052 TaxID=2576902 RepID=UPI0015C2E75B|nr:condensation domain-containing protein [Nostoc sp. C052]QLE45714.1 hypothetical protein FD723_36255 [Nostoc sp. C052]